MKRTISKYYFTVLFLMIFVFTAGAQKVGPSVTNKQAKEEMKEERKAEKERRKREVKEEKKDQKETAEFSGKKRFLKRRKKHIPRTGAKSELKGS